MLNSIVLILFISGLAFVSCTALDERFMLDNPADLVVETDNGPLEAYKSSDNHLQWAALGRIRLVKKDNSSISHYFQFDNDGFYGYLDFSLTNEDRKLLVDKARQKHSLGDIRAIQIVNMPVSKLACKLESPEISTVANVTNKSRMPILLYFKDPLNSNQRRVVKTRGKQLDSVVLKCELELNSQLSKKLSLQVIKNRPFLSDWDALFNEIQNCKLNSKKFETNNKSKLFI
jgi:hypothetical protein